MNSDKESKILRRIELLENKLARMETTLAVLSSQRHRLQSHVNAIKKMITGQILPEEDDPDE